ncbi:MAG: leucine-rich repeat domain-containing protein [Ruminococcus sp.]|nr:leucine-rich repeat domain-containing protein [Ruminococcus sp.]
MISHKHALASIIAVLSILAMEHSVPVTSFFDNSISLTANAGTTTIWDIDSNGVLTVSGIGEMEDYYKEGNFPWHSNRSEIKKVVVENGVTTLSRYAFTNCPNLESVSLPSSLTLISDSVFRNDKKLTQITIPSSVVQINQCAFMNTGLTEIVVPDSVTEMEWAVFAECADLKKAVLPSKLTYIESSMFRDCPQLESVNVPASVTKIDYSAFENCSALTSIALPGVLKEISYNVFACSGLKSIDIPAGVTSIGDSAFYGCPLLESLKINSAQTAIGKSAFADCTKLTSLDVPEGFNFAESAFAGDTAIENAPFTYQLYSGINWGYYTTDKVYWKITSDGTLTISGNTRMREGEHTASYTYEWSPYRDIVKKIVIEEGIQSVAIRGFEDFENLETVELPSSVKKICRSAFSNCPNLKYINFPEGLTEIDGFAFYGVENLQKIELPSTLTALGEASFYCCRPVKEIIIPSSVKVIPSNCFAGVNELENLVIPEGVEEIGFQAFFCVGCTEIEIPDSVTIIDDNGFIDCPNLEVVHFSSSSKLTSIGSAAFSGCEKLKSFCIPDGVTVLRNSTFAECTNLSELELSKNLVTIQSNAFTFCNKLKKLHIPTSLKTIEKNVFYSTKNLNSIIYCGTKEQWDDIYIDENNGKFHEYPQFHDYHYEVCSYCGAKNPYTNTRFEGYSINIDGSIGVNVYITLDDAILSDSQASINFIMPDNKVVNAPVSAAEKATQNGKECYIFSCHVATKDMFNPITAQIVLGDKSKVDSLSFTVSDYITALRNTQPEYAEFAESFINYGRFANCYFNESGDYPKDYTEEDYQKVLAKITPSAGITAPDYYGTSLLLKTNTVLRHYFTENAPGRQIKLPSTEGGQTYYYVEQEFCPADYDKKIDGYDYCIYDYIYKGLSSDNTDVALKNLCTALYEYAEACKKIA